MTSDPQTIGRLDQEDAHLAQTIRAHGWAVQYVGAGEQPGEPPFAYTVGLFGLGHPELVVVGMGCAASHAVLQLAAEVVDDGRDLVPGELLALPHPGRRLLVEQCPNPGDILFVANRFYRRPDAYSVPAFQLTWAHAEDLPGVGGCACAPGCQPRPGTWRA